MTAIVTPAPAAIAKNERRARADEARGPSRRRDPGGNGHTQQDTYGYGQTSVQQRCQERAHGNHLHEAPGQRQNSLPLDMDRKPAT